MATIDKKQIRILRTDSGTPPIIEELPEKAGQTWSAGSLLDRDANGYLELAASDDQLTYYGVAENAGQNLATDGLKTCRLIRLSSDLVFRGNVLGAAAADHVLVQADIAGPMGLNYDDTPKRFHLDSSEQGGADDRVAVINISQGSTLGDTNAEVDFRFLGAAIQDR